MADIGNEIDAIRAAKIGEEVRGTIADALEKMNTQAAAAQVWATGSDEPGDEPGETNNAKYYAEKAGGDAEAWAKGTRNNEPIPDDDPAHGKSAKDYAEAAATSAATLELDTTLSDATKSAQAKAVGEKVGYEIRYTPTTTFTDGYTIAGINAANPGAIISSSGNSISDKIMLDGADTVYYKRSGLSPSGTFWYYKADETPISRGGDFSSSTEQESSVPSDAAYIMYCGMTSRIGNAKIDLHKRVRGEIEQEIDETADTKVDIAQGIENAGNVLVVGEDGNVTTAANRNAYRPVYSKSYPSVPLMPEMVADFAWCSMILPAALTGHNVVMTVTGTAGSDELTVTDITGAAMADLASPSDDPMWIGCVLTSDSKAYKVYNAKYKTATTLEIYPALDSSVTDATLATLMYDSGASYTGLHLTEHGYRAYAYFLYNANPRHCEVSRYIAAYRPYIADEPNPLTAYGFYADNQYIKGVSDVNRDLQMLHDYTSKRYFFIYSAAWTAAEGKMGVTWEVNLKGKSGYLEMLLCAVSSTVEVREGYEVYVDVYIDGELTSQTVIADRIGKRILVDYENAQTGKIDIYCNKWNGNGFTISRIGWWVNTLDYDGPLFPKGAVIAQEFDSWGVFHDGVSGTALSALHNEASGVTVPYTNHSLGGQTSAWGKAYFYQNVKQYDPSISLTDFVVNDSNSVSSADIPATITGPDGTVYNNKLTKTQYAENQICIANEAINNGIQPILMRAARHGYAGDVNFTLACIDAIAQQEA